MNVMSDFLPGSVHWQLGLAGLGFAAVLPQKSVKSAVLYSVIATVLPIVVSILILSIYPNSARAGLPVLAGLVFGPSVGLWYAGANSRAWRGAGIRLAAFFVLIAGAAYSVGSIFDGNTAGINIGNTGFIIGGGVMIGSTVWDTFVAGPRTVSAVRARTENKPPDANKPDSL